MDRDNGRTSGGHFSSEASSLFSESNGSSDDRYTIGEVVSTLRAEFPSLSVSKVRYLERRRLIELERTSGGYRLFTDDDIELLRRVLTLQENEYLPLEVIKQRIESGAISYNREHAADDPESEIVEPRELKSYTREGLCEELEADPSFIEELFTVGVIGRGSRGTRGSLDSRDLEIARMAMEMSKYSIQPRHLRGIVAAVDREVAMFKQVLNPEFRSGDDKRISDAMEKARRLASVDARFKELIMASTVESLDPR